MHNKFTNPSNDINSTLDYIHSNFTMIELDKRINQITEANDSLRKIESKINIFINTENKSSSCFPPLRHKISIEKIDVKEIKNDDDGLNNQKCNKIIVHKITRNHTASNLTSNNNVKEPLKDQNENTSPRRKVRQQEQTSSSSSSSSSSSNSPSKFSFSPCCIMNKIKILKIKSNKGDVASQLQLGACYSCGEGVPRDESIALKYFMQAAEQGDKSAQFIVGTYFLYGKGTEIDKEKSLSFFLKSAEQGYDKAQFAVGHFYKYEKSGNEDDERKAFEWFKKASSQGNKAAMNAIKSKFE